MKKNMPLILIHNAINLFAHTLMILIFLQFIKSETCYNCSYNFHVFLISVEKLQSIIEF